MASRSRPCARRRSSPTSPSRCTRTTSATARRSAARSIVPYVERRVPVIADERIDREFGTGALKVTPGHDPLDFEIGRDHGLPEPMVVGSDGRMNEAGRRPRRADAGGGGRARARVGARSAGSSRSASRTGTRSGPASAAIRASSRSSRCSGGARWRSRRRRRSRRCASAACATTRSRSTASRSRRSRRHPTGASRASSGGGISSRSGRAPTATSPCRWTSPSACAECGSTELERESDVLDTWFSSALWPYATLGWPDETPELARYYPGNVNSTAREIIRLWENRMIWTGLEALGDVPFTDVIIHSTVLARRRPADVEEPRHGHRPDGADRGVRRRRDALRAAQDLVDAGRALLVRRDRGGAQARDQALERRAAASCRTRRASTPRPAPHEPRGALDPRAHRRGPRRARGRLERVSTSPSRRRRSTTSRSTTSATGTRRRSSRGCTTATRPRSRPRSPRSSGCSRSSIP